MAAVLLVPSAAFAAPQDLDPHFGGSGKVTTDVGRYDAATAVAIDAHGRIVVGGSTGNGPQADFLVARYLPGGSLDGSFGNGGIVTTDFIGHDDRVSSMRLDSRGRIVVGGTSRDASGHRLAALARYRRDGTLDPSFSGDGKVLANLGNYDAEANAMAIDSQDRIIVAGSFFIDHQDLFDYNDVVLARFKANGALDSAFGTNGKVATNWGQEDFAYALALDSQSRIIAAGESEFETSSFVVGRYTPDGDVDSSFGNQGFAGVRLGDPYFEDYARAITLDNQGRVVAAGVANADTGASAFVLTRYDADGEPDPSFGTNGVVTTKFGDNARANAVLTDDQGRIVAVGAGNRFDLARYGPNGVLDPSFGTRGKVITLFASSGAYAAAAALDSRGRIVVAGTVGAETGSDLALARYTGKDATPPDVTIEGRRTLRTRHHRARARFRFTASEPASFECAIDGGQARPCTSPYRTPKLPTGHHRLKVLATDAAGNTGSAGEGFRIKRRR